MPVAEDTEFVTVTEAMGRLGVSKQKMADLIRDGVFQTEESPLDKRVKLIRRVDLETVLRRWHHKRKGESEASE